MDKQVVVITGAGSGLGASLAKRYSEQGYHVCLLGRTKAKLERTAEQLAGSNSIHVGDVASRQAIMEMMTAIIKKHGSIDVLINNAGTGSFDLAENLTEEAVHQMIDINLKGTIFSTQEVLKQMKEQNRGTIINIVSTAGKVGKANESVYCASKFGVRGFTESLYIELKETPIQVIGIYMGGMKTEFWNGIFTEERMKHLMEPDDVADVIMANVKPRQRLIVSEVVIQNQK
ncbi:3-oxoacyl-[acyl-carrier protein] reductase [Brevibacillus laterosporus]|uniref:SDR family oxidoreductase n=1 Tax=Brevibacillus laterosporus TaxID=1465 RepID=A0A518VEA9_BRELA|nr:SDR family oxidoreductase [Brevibacillus laterosporus]QDX95341.1 SDR family oxidoreductase [Brevibacillus laterosporus]RAP28590.1 3-oxoacyl-[acyl-carrier protein] reductase [Brevibacillus laterosporus]